MQPLQYDLRCPAVKDRRITHAAAAASNPSTPGATFVRENIAFRAIPNIHANITFPKQFQCDLQSLPCKSQKNCVDQGCKHLHEVAITTRSEHLNRTLQWGTRPSASRTRRTTEVSPIDAGSHFVRENIMHLVQFLTSKHHLPQQFHCDLQSLPCKSQKNYVDQGCKHPHEAAMAMWSAYFTLEDAPEREPHPSHKQGSPHWRREPLCARKDRFLCDS